MKIKHRLQITVSPLLALLALSGCSSQLQTTTVTPVHIAAPSTWQVANSTPIDDTEPAGWVQPFDSPELSRLIEEALQHNYTLERAHLALQQARQQTILGNTSLRPLSEGKLAIGRSRAQSSSTATYSSSHVLQLSTTWEADLWQRLSDQQQATLHREAASAVDLNAARLLLVAEVVRNWFQATAAGLQLKLSQARLQQYREAENIILQRYQSGLATALDLHLARSEVAIAEERLGTRQQEQQRLLRSLESLVGRYPAATLQVDAQLPPLSREIPAGIPATLLQRRPDIEVRYQELRAAALESSAADKNRLPSFSLTAKGGTSSSELNNLLDWDNLIWSLLGNLTQPLFQQDKLQAEAAIQALLQQQAAVNYAETVLGAFQEVENGLANDHFYRLRVEALERASESSRQASTLAMEQYQGGIIDILTLLDAQQRAYDRQSALLQAQANRVDNRIQLHLALGGGYNQ